MRHCPADAPPASSKLDDSRSSTLSGEEAIPIISDKLDSDKCAPDTAAKCVSASTGSIVGAIISAALSFTTGGGSPIFLARIFRYGLKAVPAGIKCPKMTFSFSPSSESVAPLIEGAESNEKRR